jgi:hypothetical protein
MFLTKKTFTKKNVLLFFFNEKRQIRHFLTIFILSIKNVRPDVFNKKILFLFFSIKKRQFRHF